MAKMMVEDTSLTAVADAIRAKTGASEALEFPNGFIDAIEGTPATLKINIALSSNSYRTAICFYPPTDGGAYKFSGSTGGSASTTLSHLKVGDVIYVVEGCFQGAGRVSGSGISVTGGNESSPFKNSAGTTAKVFWWKVTITAETCNIAIN